MVENGLTAAAQVDSAAQVQPAAREELLQPGARVFVAGHRGLVGSAIRRRLDAEGFEVVVRTRDELDLRNSADTAAFLDQTRPDAVVLAAAKVGGIMANSTFPVQFLEDNLRIQLSVISGSHAAGVQRLLFLGSSCIYPKLAPQPIREDVHPDRPAGEDEPGLRAGQDRGHRAGQCLPQPVRRVVHLGDADQPVRAGRQLRSGQLARAAGADPPLPRGQAGRMPRR